jgi:rhodanese-related sulfurtransferase
MSLLELLAAFQGGPSLTPEQVAVGPEGDFIVDVREPAEFRAGHIPGAKLIPLGQLAGRTGEIPRDRRVVCVCRSGRRSAAAVRLLRSLGVDAYNLHGGMRDWPGRVVWG